MSELHSLLRRQLRRYAKETDPDLENGSDLLKAVNEAYWEFDSDRRMLERSMELTSQELLESNLALSKINSELEARVAERTADLNKVNEQLRRELVQRKQGDTLRETLLDIMQGWISTKDLQDFLSLVHRSIAKVFYAENFFVVLYNKDAARFEEIYAVDEFDPPGPPSWHEKSISAYIFRTGQPLLLTDERVFNVLVAQGKVELVGTNSPSWMGVPLKTSKETIGVMVVQDYETPNRYSERDLGLFASIAGQVAQAVEHRRAQEALAASEAELRAIFAGMTDVVIIFDVNGRYVKIAPTHPRYLYRPPDEMLGKTVYEILPKDLADYMVAKVRESTQSGQVVSGEYTLKIDEEEIWRSGSFSPLSETTAILVAHDITSSKQAEIALQRAEQRYRGLFENAPAMYVVTQNVEGNPIIADCNELFSRTLGYSRDELLGQPVVNLYSPASRVLFREGGYEAALKGEFGTQERELITRDGRIIPTLVSAFPEHDDAGGIFGTRATFVDITGRRKAEKELRDLKNELETTNLQLQQALEREKILACTDGLTGLYNHRYFFELATREFHASIRHQRPLAFLMFDVDNFKPVNDTLGHAAGDRLLVKVAQTVVAQMRASDVVARYGGDEFVVMLPHTSAEQALHVTKRIHAGIGAIEVETDKVPFPITLSIGIAELRQEPMDENVERITQRADDALYNAKRGGRNQSVVFSQDETRIKGQ